MKLFYFIAFIFIAKFVSAFECPPNQDPAQDDIETLYKNAEKVLFLRVTKGELVAGQIKYQAELVEALKGDLINAIKLTDTSFIGSRNITVGNYYLIYLYESEEIDSCTLLIDLSDFVDSIDKLIEFSKREDILNADIIRKTLELSNIEMRP